MPRRTLLNCLLHLNILLLYALSRSKIMLSCTGVAHSNSTEPLLHPPDWLQPSLVLGCFLEEALSHLPASFTQAQHPASSSYNAAASQLPASSHHTESSPSSSRSGDNAVALQQSHNTQLATLMGIYRDQKHMLVWRGGKGWALLRSGAAKQDLLQPLLQVGQIYFSWAGLANSLLDE